MATLSSQYPVPESGAALARRTVFGVLVGVVAALLVAGLVDASGLVVGVNGPQSPFGAVPIVMSTIVAGVGAAVAYAGLVRLTERPVRNFVAVSAVVFTAMLVPVFVIAPSLGLTAVGQAALVLLHVAVAVPIVAFVVGAVRL
jgi:hypothetical protein